MSWHEKRLTVKKVILATLAFSLTGCGSSASDLVSQPPATIPAPAPQQALLDEPPPVEAPRAFDDTFRLAENEPLLVSVLENDTHHGARVVAFDAQGSRGGQVSITPDGLLSYVPPPGNEPGRDVFGYTIQNEVGVSRATVAAVKARTIYVNNQAASNGDGSKGRPFNTLQAALDSAGSDDANIFVAQGDGTSRNLDPAQINLQAGQAILGQDGKKPPHIRSAIRVSSFDCHLESLILEGGSGPTLMRVDGLVAGGFSNPPLILKNLVMQDGDVEAMRFENPDNTEVTNLQVLRHNRQGGQAALVFQNPTGRTKISGLTIQDNPQAGVLLENTQGGDYGPNGLPFEIDGYFPNRLNNPFMLRASAGHLQFRLNNFNCKQQDNLSGTLFAADVSGQALCEAWLSGLDFRKIGNQTGILNWTYREQSSGTVRFGSSTTDYRDQLVVPDDNVHVAYVIPPPNNNGLTFVTRDTAQGNLVFSGTHLSGVNPTNIDAHDKSLAKVRLTKYSWQNANNFWFQMWAHDTAQIFSRIYDDKTVFNIFESRAEAYEGWTLPILTWRCDLNAGQRIERADNLDYDNPSAPLKWIGFEIDRLTNQYEESSDDTWAHASYWEAKNFSGANVDELGIPKP